MEQTLELLKAYDVGLPILIEETFPLNSGVDDYRSFLNGSRGIADGWLSFYWGETIEALRERDEASASAVLEASAVFEEFGSGE